MELNPERTPPSTSKDKADIKFLEESLTKTPDPQACSTVNRQRDLDEFPVPVKTHSIETADEPKFLMDERNTIDSLHQKLNEMFERIRRDSISSNAQPAASEVNSSLGILKIDDMEDLNDTYSSKVLESLMPKKVDDCETSWMTKRELARQSISSRPSLDLENKAMKPHKEFDFSIDRASKGGMINPFDGERCSGLPSFDEHFDTGASAKQRLLEDEANWMQTNADIPVANTDRSLSGIFAGDDAAGNISSASSFLRCGSGPIGSLGGGKDHAQRPHFGREIFSPVKVLDSTGCIADVVPKECSVNQSTAEAGLDLSVSSIASVTQIKEMLGEMGQNSPTLIINKLMNAEGRKRAKQANRVDSQNKPGNTHTNRKENMSTIDLTNDRETGSKSINQRGMNEIVDLSSTTDYFQSMKPFASPQRSALQDMTNLQRSPVKVIDLDTNSTILDPSASKINDNTKAELGRVRNNARELSLSTLEISSDSFMVGPLSRSTSIEDIGQAINASSCNSSVIDDTDDNIKLRYCIGSICNVMITLSNSSADNNVLCSISLIEVLKNKQLCPKAVKTIFPPEVTLAPGETKKVEIQVIPFAIGVLDVALQVDEVEENSEDLRSFLCTVTLKSEKPRLVISKVSEDEFVNNNQIDFGLLPEESLRKSVISIENIGSVKVPLNITVSDDSSKFQVFYLREDDKSQVVEKLVILDPGERLEESIFCFTPALEHNNLTKTTQGITGELCVSLASVVCETTKFARYHLSTTVGYTRVLISPNCNPLIVPAYEKRPLLIKNASILPLTLNLRLEDAEFALESDVIRLDSNQDGAIMVEFSPMHFKNNLQRAGRLWLCIDSTETRYEVKIIGQCTVNHGLITSSTSSASDSIARPKSVASVMTSSSPRGSKTTTPYTSRSSSPCSSNLSSAERGSLDLASTHSALVWASCSLQVAERKGCVLRNKNNYKEKLHLAIVDNSGCYKLVEEKGNTVQEMRINLEGMESRQVTVSYCPLQVGACKASLVITRANQKSVCGQPNRKVLQLYGYGGKAVLNIRGVNKDPENKMWMYLDPDDIRAQFTLENSGDGTAFVRISQDIADTGVTITPREALIPSHKKITVDLSFSPTTGRADHLLLKSEDSDVLVVTRLKIMFGDEATRLRLKRLYRKMINDGIGMDSLLMERLSVLDNLFPGSSSGEISCLKDTQVSMKTLWVEGIRETSIGVMLEKSALENAQLDATAHFMDLATTVTDDTVYVPKQQLIVAPRVVNLSWTQPSASFTLRNTTVLPIRVQIETVAGLSVEPASHILAAHSSCTITVTRSNSGAEIAASSLLKIYSDCTDVIEVPVNWNKITRLADTKDEPANERGDVFSTDYNVDFPSTVVGGKTVARVCLCNTTQQSKMILVESVDEPFEVRTLEFLLKGRWYLNLRIYFKPTASGAHFGKLVLSVDKDKILTYKLSGRAFHK